MLSTQKDPYYSKKDTLRWHGASFQIIQVFMWKVLRSTHSCDMCTNETSTGIVQERCAKVKLKLQHSVMA